MGLPNPPRPPRPPRPPKLPKWLRWLSPLGEPRVWIPLVVVLAVLALAALLWLLTGNWLAGVVVALAVALIALMVVLLRTLFARERAAHRERGIDDRPAAFEAERAQGAGVASIEDGFRRAVDEIRHSRLGGGGVQTLPWYLVLGETGAGKSALLRESGLDLPAEIALSLGQGPTRSCDWWLSDDGVFLDSAGRFLAAGDDGTQNEWATLLRLVRRARPGCALNGLVVCLPVTTLLGRSAAELEEQALTLRRRINELTDELGVDFPIYVVVTKADLIEGFTETVNALPRERRGEVLGWTNERREFADAGELVAQGLGRMRDRFEALAPELVAADPDPQRRRRLFFFPQELDAACGAVATLIGRAFAPTAYDETPFLRGVYFTSARREGTAQSPLLHRMGHEWAASRVDGSTAPGGLFERDLFGEVIVGDATLAVPVQSLSPRARRLVHATVGFFACVLILWWTLAFFSNWAGIRRLDDASALALAGGKNLETVERLRRTIQDEAGDFTLLRRGGLGGSLQRALERARTTFVWAFDREFEHPTKTKLMGAVRGYDDESFEALAQLAVDVTWLATRADAEKARRPDLLAYAPVPHSQEDARAFRDGYDDFVHWASDDEIRARIAREREVVASAAGRLLEVRRLETWSNRSSDTYPPARYADVGLPAPDTGAAVTQVAGAYTRPAWEGLVSGLIDAIDRTGGASEESVEQFRRGYVSRYETSWRNYLLDVPLPARADADVQSSPYLAFVEQLYQQTGATLPGPDGQPAEPPAWVGVLREVRRETPREGDPEGQPPPWRRYRDALEQVAADVAAAQERSDLALRLALDMAGDDPTSFSQAIGLVQELVPRRDDPQATLKLREVLEMPVLDAATSVLVLARSELERQWRDRIGQPFAGSLDSQGMQALYGPQGELHRFESEALGPFVSDGTPRPVIGDRAMPLGRDFLGWVESADRVSSALYPTGLGAAPQIPVRLEGIPSKVVSGGAVRVSRREIRVACAEGEQVFRYREGSGSKTFLWSPDCTEVTLRLWALEPGGNESELLPAPPPWTGPMALPEFLQDAQRLPGKRLQWTLRYEHPEVEVSVLYRMRGDDGILRIAHSPPPDSLAN